MSLIPETMEIIFLYLLLREVTSLPLSHHPSPALQWCVENTMSQLLSTQNTVIRHYRHPGNVQGNDVD